ncbi:MAG: dihydrofolate reductase [Maricaulaceae bacterium]
MPSNPALTPPILSAIVAKSRNGVIGIDGDLPWKLSSDLKFFKATTLGKPVLMGRKTWESLPFPLPGRANLVLTRNAGYKAPKAQVFTDVHAMIGQGYEIAGETGVDEIMLIGGAMLYASLMKYCQRLYVTEVDALIEGDAHFPAIIASDWTAVSETSYPQGPKDDYPFAVKIYERRIA